MTEPAAGWYHDPADAGAWRWWDGATWTDHVRPAEDAVYTAPAPVVLAPVVIAPVVIEPVPTHPPVFEQPVVALASQPVVPEPVFTAPAPVQPAPPVQLAPPVLPAPPVAAPQPVATASIPQPGQVAAAPAATGGPVSMTPTTPIGDQMYWHSSAAEVIEVPRLNQSTGAIAIQRGKQTLPSYVRDWNDLGSPNTAGIWLLALSPILGLGVFYAVATAMRSAGLAPIVGLIAGGVASLLLHWIFAAVDARALAERGYHAPRVAWMLLFPPLAYLIARGKAVRRESKAAWGPELVYILSWLGIIGAIVALSAFVLALYAPYLSAL
jgi:hypothetical protein